MIINTVLQKVVWAGFIVGKLEVTMDWQSYLLKNENSSRNGVSMATFPALVIKSFWLLWSQLMSVTGSQSTIRRTKCEILYSRLISRVSTYFCELKFRDSIRYHQLATNTKNFAGENFCKSVSTCKKCKNLHPTKLNNYMVWLLHKCNQASKNTVESLY